MRYGSLFRPVKNTEEFKKAVFEDTKPKGKIFIYENVTARLDVFGEVKRKEIKLITVPKISYRIQKWWEYFKIDLYFNIVMYLLLLLLLIVFIVKFSEVL